MQPKAYLLNFYNKCRLKNKAEKTRGTKIFFCLLLLLFHFFKIRKSLKDYSLKIIHLLRNRRGFLWLPMLDHEKKALFQVKNNGGAN